MTGKPGRPESVTRGSAVSPLRLGRFTLDSSRPLVMGVVNVTPDSFYDGGRHSTPSESIAHAQLLIDQGADILDIGAESTRPGAAPIDAAAELERLLPVLRALRHSPVPISVDTMKPEVMRAAAAEGASLINDVYALRLPGALEAVAGGGASVCLMHMRGDPRTMQTAPHYEDVVAEVKTFLAARAEAAVAAGISRERIIVDPGFGFGKTVGHNMRLLACLRSLGELGYPVLFGASRKSSLGAIAGRPANERLAASIAAALLAAERGAAIVRVHDVAETRDALAILSAMNAAAGP